MSYLKWMPASSDPSGFCGLYSRFDLRALHRDGLGDLLAAAALGVTLVMMTSFILMIRNSCWPLPALRTVTVASLMCSPLAHAFNSTGEALST